MNEKSLGGNSNCRWRPPPQKQLAFPVNPGILIVAHRENELSLFSKLLFLNGRV
jgi:hypothetical protein